MAGLSGVANSDDGSGVIHVVEEVPTGHDDGVCFSHPFCAGGHSQRACDAVCARIPEEDGASGGGVVDDLLEGVGVVVDAVTGGTAAAGALECGNGEVLVLGLGAGVVYAALK